MASISVPSREKSADKIEGAILIAMENRLFDGSKCRILLCPARHRDLSCGPESGPVQAARSPATDNGHEDWKRLRRQWRCRSERAGLRQGTLAPATGVSAPGYAAARSTPAATTSPP